MSVIVFANSKRNSGRTTAALLAATEFVRMGYRVSLLDADVNCRVGEWSETFDGHKNLDICRDVTEANVGALIADRKSRFDFVIVDLPADLSPVVGLAVIKADHVVVPVQETVTDLVLELLERLRSECGKVITHSVLFTRFAGSASQQVSVDEEAAMKARGTRLMKSAVVQHDAFSDILMNGTPLHKADALKVARLSEAREFARAFAIELLWNLPVVKRKRKAVSVPSVASQKLAA